METGTPATELLPRDGSAVLHERVYADADFEEIRRAVDWRAESVRIFGREHPVPRLVAYYGEHAYRYSGVDHPARPLPAPLDAMLGTAAAAAGCTFNSVLCNLYRDGRDGMGYHRDNEPEIDPSCIASVSLGATRRFRFRHRDSRETVTVDPEHGTLLLMRDCQEHWEHTLVKTRRPVGPRINLTFRVMRSRG